MTMTELVILAVLLDEKCTIYRIQKKIDASFFIFYSSSMGSIYPAIKKLYLNKYLSVETSITEGGHRRSVYAITEDGKKYFEDIMLNSALNEQTIKIKLLILPKMEKVKKNPIINNIKKYYQNRLLVLENFCENHRNNYVKHCIDILIQEIEWINRQELF
jgi:DNA-binding PadR family transcriptional regulator